MARAVDARARARTLFPVTDRTFVLGLDLDGVVADYGPAFRAFVGAELGIDPATMSVQDAWDLVRPDWGIRDLAHLTELQTRAVNEARIFRTMGALPGAAEALWRLSDAGVWIRIVTHRIAYKRSFHAATSDTVDWLEYGPPGAAAPSGRSSFIPYRDLCFIADKPQVGADLYIDDAPHNVEALRAAGAAVVVFDQPYNRHLAGPRAHDWAEAEALVRAARDGR